MTRTADDRIKKGILEYLAECVKSLQFTTRGQQGTVAAYASTGDGEAALCSALEALFLHGLKDSFLSRARFVFGSDSSPASELTFWPCALVLSHKDTVRTLTNLGQIKTEVGLCRAWVRLALNEGLVSSHLSSLSGDRSVAKSFYRKSAMLLDAELLDVARRLLDGLESCVSFELPINSSLLNSWTEETLVLAGLRSAASAYRGIAPAFDIASVLEAGESPRRTPPPAPDPDLLGLGRMLAMDQDEAFDYIISNVPASEGREESERVQSEAIQEEDSATIKDPEEAIPESSDVEPVVDDQPKEQESSEQPEEEDDAREQLGEASSVSDGSLSLLDFEIDRGAIRGELVRTLREELKIDTVEEPPPPEPETSKTEDRKDAEGFVVVDSEFTSFFDSAELDQLKSQLGKLATESGLDSQFYRCANCPNMLRTVGRGDSEARVCHFSGKYYCAGCIHPDVFVIPARVIHNWDFKRYSVSSRAAEFLLEFQHHPLLNMKKMNPLIYQGVDSMMRLLVLRTKLNLLKNYLFSCREPVIRDLQKRVWPREYLYESVHTYSVSDLVQVSNGSFAILLQKAVTFAQSHVSDCWLCSQKGFICEVCHDPKILYPFDIESTFRCEACCNVFHLNCLTKDKPCPKCDRKKRRQCTSLVNAIHSNV